MSVNNVVIPNTAKILKIFDPIIFPKASCFSFFIPATIEAVNSGILVPTAIILIEITLSVTPHSFAIKIAESTRKSEPKYKLKDPIIK